MGGQFLLDVRTPQEFKEHHIAGSKNIPLQKLPENLEKLLQVKQEILLICRTGARALGAKEFLEGNEIKNTKVLEGGLMENKHLL